jgi:hypothetical protein
MLEHHRTVRCRISGEYVFCVFITPISQELEPPTIPARFKRGNPEANRERQRRLRERKERQEQ